MIWLVVAVAFGRPDVVEVKPGEPVTFDTPGAWVAEARYRAYVEDSRTLESCKLERAAAVAKLDTAASLVLAANERLFRAEEVAKEQFGVDEAELTRQVQLNTELALRLEDADRKLDRVRNQRNLAWAITGGFLAASAAAIVLSL